MTEKALLRVRPKPRQLALILVQTSLSIVLWAPGGYAAPPGYDEHWPFNKVPFTIAEKAMGPQDGSVLAIVNNRPVRYGTEQYEGDVSILESFFSRDILKIAE
ncbi:MAG TPA: hypothetical protein V6D08_09145, partial [Candidatus Obscuribacterales bacterium]